MKKLWRFAREVLNGALHQAAVKILVAVLAAFGAVEAAQDVAAALAPAPAVAAEARP